MIKARAYVSLLTIAVMACFASGPAQSQSAANCGLPVADQDGWKIAPPQSVGFDPSRLCQWVEHRVATPMENIHAVLVVRHGELVFERYFTGDDELFGRPLGQVAYDRTKPHDMRSISKTVTPLLLGIALEQKKVASVDTPVFDYFTDDPDLKTPEKNRITLRHLLTMSSGLAWDEFLTPYANPNNSERRIFEAADPYRYVLSQPVAAAPGAMFNYSSGSTTLLGAILHKATGQTVDDFARSVLFGPLGITDFEWLKLSNGEPMADAGLRLRPRDLAKIGQLALARGMWEGRQVVPAAYIDEAMKPQIESLIGPYFYGYQWWLGRSLVDRREGDWAAGLGLGGQRVFVVPSLDVVVVTTSGLYTSPLQEQLTLEILGDVLSAVQ